MENKKSLFRNTAIILVCAWLLIFVLIPNLLVVITSFLQRDPVNFVAPSLSLDAYKSLLEPAFLRVFTASFWLSFIVALICLFLGYPFAYFLTRMPRRYHGFLLVLVIIPFWTSSLVRTYALMGLMRMNGIINTWLIKLGIIGESGIISNPIPMLYTEGAVVFGLVYNLLPFMILPLYVAIDKLDVRLIEAAQDLGANRFQRFWRIIFPLTLPGIIAGSILVFLPAMGLFYIPDLLGGSKNMLVGNLIQDRFLAARDWPFGSAASVVLTLVMAVMLFAYWRSIKRFNGSLIT